MVAVVEVVAVGVLVVVVVAAVYGVVECELEELVTEDVHVEENA